MHPSPFLHAFHRVLCEFCKLLAVILRQISCSARIKNPATVTG
ncbi:hypothetical protein HMPREF0208_02415 [Citrobacter koseri]|nr:hypothetical protein HMPREF3220_03139 [Citrobacter koseri]KXA00225.1 hypothetical protein HMPREF3207_03700 [Citrobacter koseri]KXB43821.1 hypothetical protein HMPREF0208_02415 [Citrobacter koseri]